MRRQQDIDVDTRFLKTGDSTARFEDLLRGEPVHHWKSMSVFVAASRSKTEVAESICAQIRIDATQSGDFVEAIRIDSPQRHSTGWTRWSAQYLLGPPGSFPTPEELTFERRRRC
jgi:hypothetical protein